LYKEKKKVPKRVFIIINIHQICNVFVCWEPRNVFVMSIIREREIRFKHAYIRRIYVKYAVDILSISYKPNFVTNRFVNSEFHFTHVQKL